MRRKSERNKSKSSEKKLDTPARKSRRTSRRRKRSTSHTSSDDSDDAPLIKPVVVETPAAEITLPLVEPKKSTSNSDEEKQEQPIWKVKTSDSPSGEIQKLKICLQRPSTTPERTEKSPRRRRAKASSQSDDAYLTPDEKPQQQQQIQGRRKLRRGSPPPGEPVDKDDGERKVIKDVNDEASAGKGKLECSQRRQDTENAECVQDSEVKKSLGSSELSNDIPQEEDIKSTTSKDEQEIIIIAKSTTHKDTEVETSPPIKTQDSAIEPIKTECMDIESIKAECMDIEPIKAECMDIEPITTQASEQTESKDSNQTSTQLKASPKREPSTIEVESKKCNDESSPKTCNIQSSPISDSKKDEAESSIKTQTSDSSAETTVESSPTKDSKGIKASPTKSESSSNKSEDSEQTSIVLTPKKSVDSAKSSNESSPIKDSQPPNESEETLVKSSDLLKIELNSSEKVSEDSPRPETTDEVSKDDKKEKCEIKKPVEETSINEVEDVEMKDSNKEDHKTNLKESVAEETKMSTKVQDIKDTDKSELINETKIIDASEKTEAERMNDNSESLDKEDMEQISETIKRDLNRSSERISERKNSERDDSDKSEPEEKIVISEDEETKTEKSTTPTPETQQIIRPLHRRKWGKYPAKLRSDIRLTLESITAIYPQMKLVAEEDLKLETEEHKEVIKPVRKEREVVVMPQISPKEEDTEKEVSNIGLNRKISIVNDEASKLQPPPSPPKHPVSSILYITNLVRPFTLKQLKELLSRTGKILDDGFWTDRIKSRCYVQYETEDEAEATRNALHGVQWPIGNGKKLMIDFGLPESMEAARTAVETPVAAVKAVPEKIVEKVPEFDKKEQQVNEDDRWDKKRAAAPTREWDLGKVPQDRSRSRDRPRSRSDRSSDKRRHPQNESPSNGDHLSPRKKKKEEQVEVKLMDDLFRKTKATPSIYWLPLTPDQIAKKQQQRLQRMAEHKRRMEESTRRVPLRDFGRGAPRSRRRSDRFNAD